MSVYCNTLTHEDGQVITWWTIFCHKDTDPEKCRSWRVATDDAEDIADIEVALKQMSEYMNYQV